MVEILDADQFFLYNTIQYAPYFTFSLTFAMKSCWICRKPFTLPCLYSSYTVDNLYTTNSVADS